MLGAELPGERFLVRATSDGDCPKAHFGSELNAEMAEAAQTKHGDDFSRPGAAVPKRIEGGDAGTHEGRPLDRR